MRTFDDENGSRIIKYRAQFSKFPRQIRSSRSLGAGVLLLAVFVSAILDPRWTHTGRAGEARSDNGSDYVVDGIPQQRTARGWKWGSLTASRTTSRRASDREVSLFARQFAT